MLNVNSLMTEQAAALGIEGMIPWILVGVCALVLVIALIVGFVKGFRRIGFGGLTLGVACGGYVAIQLLLGDANPVKAIPLPETLTVPVQGLVYSAITAVACILVALIVFGLLALIVRPAETAGNKQYIVDGGRKAADDEFEDDDWDDDGYYDSRSLKKQIKRQDSPCFFNRLMGAIFGVVNTAVILAFVVGTILLVGYVTPFKDTFLKATYETEWIAFAFTYVQTYAIDFLIIAILMGCISNGYKSGIFEGVRAVLLRIGYLLGFAGGVYLAFSPLAAEGQALAFLNNFVVMVATPLQEAVPMVTADIAVIAGKIVVGIVCGIVLDIVVFMIGWLLGKFADVSADGGVLGFIDGILSAVIHILIGALIVFLLGMILYCLQQYNVFAVGDLFNENSSLINGLFTLYEEWILPLLQTYFNLGA